MTTNQPKDDKFLKDSDWKHSEKVDKEESVDAKKTDAEKGLTKLDSAYRAEWQANGFPQTRKEMKELEEAEKEDK